jgi:putative hemolysin
MTTAITLGTTVSKPLMSGFPSEKHFRPAPSGGTFRLTASGPLGHTYIARLARSPEEVQAAQALPLRVFSHDFHQGLTDAFATGWCADPFDMAGDHLIVEDVSSCELIATYRLKAGARTAVNGGFHSARQFDLTSLAPLYRQLIEIGGACVAQHHRISIVVQLLWRGIAFYAQALGARYLFGRTCLGVSDPRLGASLYSQLCPTYLAPGPLQTQPLPGCSCPLDELPSGAAEVPRLLAAYLSLGAFICGPPAIDRQLGTLDFLTVLDLQNLSPNAGGRSSDPLTNFIPSLMALFNCH